MIKKILLLSVFILFINGCGYKPIYSTKDQNFSLENINYQGEIKVNNLINKILKNYSNNSNAKNTYEITINSSLKKNIITKNKKGNAIRFSLDLSIDLIVFENSEQKRKIKFLEKSSYNNKDNKFDLKMYENNLIENMSEKIISDMLFFFQNIE